MQVDARLRFEFVDFRVSVRQFRRVAAENAWHGFVQHPLYIDDKNGVRGGEIARDIQGGGGEGFFSFDRGVARRKQKGKGDIPRGALILQKKILVSQAL